MHGYKGDDKGIAGEDTDAKMASLNINLEKIIPRIDNSKTANDFGFHKRSFEMVFIENEVAKLDDGNIEKEILALAADKLGFSLAKDSMSSVDTAIAGHISDMKKDFRHGNNSMAGNAYSLSLEDLKDSNKNARQARQKEDAAHERSDYNSSIAADGASSYLHHSELYCRFMKEYLKDSQAGITMQSAAESLQGSSQKKGFEQGEELINYHERINHVRAVMMNSLMHAPVNNVDLGAKERYEFWKMASKFNQVMSFLYYDSVLM
ncbi:hypothetical protein JXB31_04705 [Candidatus Woesearchaeota archaeon]|nr:hypothetical protein [Candidatus Woesearchaeota archaeon]